MPGHDVITKCPACGEKIDMHFDMSGGRLSVAEAEVLIEIAKRLHNRKCPQA